MSETGYILSKKEYEGLLQLLRKKTVSEDPHIEQPKPQHTTYVKVTAHGVGWYPAVVQTSDGDGNWTDGATCEVKAANDTDVLTIGGRYEARRTGDKSDGTPRYRCVAAPTLAMISVGSSSPDVNGWYQGAGYTYDPDTGLLVTTIPVCFVRPPEAGGGGGYGLHLGDIVLSLRLDDVDNIPRFVAFASLKKETFHTYKYACENGNLVETEYMVTALGFGLQITVAES
jgi:hypothetical protein